MANEMRHNTVGTSLTQIEFEDVALHIFNSQATGDILYASSATQLSKLAIGGANTVLVVSGGIPSWSATLAGLTLTAPAINGTVTTTGLTLPAFILGGALNANNQNITGIGSNMQGYADTSYINIVGGSTPDLGALISLSGATRVGSKGKIAFYTTNATDDGIVERFSLLGSGATVVGTWYNMTHAGIVLSGALNANTMDIDNVENLGIGIASNSGYKLLAYGSTPKIAIQDNTGTTDIWSLNATAATQALDVVNNTSGFGTVLSFLRTGAPLAGYGIKIGTDSTNNQIDDASNGAGSTTLYIGNASINVTSDARAKTNISEYEGNATELLSNIPIKQWKYLPEYRPFGNQDDTFIGMTAQDLLKTVPWIINRQGNDTKMMMQARYELLVGLLIKSNKELSKRIEKLEVGDSE